MNILLTNYCDQACPYCFAESYMRDSQKNIGKIAMSMKGFDLALGLLRKAKVSACKLSGGEPTLHPDFESFVNHALKNDMRLIQLCTNGLFNRDTAEFLASKGERILYLWNINHPRAYRNDKERDRLNYNLNALLPRGNSTFGITFYRANMDTGFMFKMLKKYRPAALRVCFSHPSGRNPRNIYLPTSEAKKILPDIVTLAKKAWSIGIPSVFDCGIPSCLANSSRMAFFRKNGLTMGGCGIVPSITPDLRVLHCFLLEKEPKRYLKEFKSLAEIYSYLSRIKSGDRKAFLFRKCRECDRECDLGCQIERTGFLSRLKTPARTTK